MSDSKEWYISNPHLLDEWDTSNEKIPEEVSRGSHYRARWRCYRGHTWGTPVKERLRGTRCPYCTNVRCWPGFNDLKTVDPEIASQWSTKNGSRAEETLPGSTKVVIWDCPGGHEWTAAPAKRLYTKSCPVCSGKRVMPGVNDLATTHPEVAQTWSGNGVSPKEVTYGSNKKLSWVCPLGHEWESAAHTRVAGHGCPTCSGRRVKVGFNDLASTAPWLAEEWGGNQATPQEVTQSSNKNVEWVCEKGHRWVTTPSSRTSGKYGCRQCVGGGTSKTEKEVVSALTRWGLTVKPHHRNVAPGFEYDAVIENLKVAVEFNGLYWHSEGKKGVDYHLRKTRAANAAGYQLIHVWEDDWVYRRPVVEKMLKRKLGVSDEPRLNARSLTFREVSTAESSKFLEENHIQGASGGSWKGGLFAGEKLVALMVMKRRSEGVYELIRFATTAIVRGGHSKLLKRAIGDLNPWEVVTFSDNCVSGGELYEGAGFEKVKELAPDYTYRVGQRREHKFNYRKARFKRDPNLKYEEGLTERELADLNGLDRVYDAGKVRWVLYV